MIIAQGKVIISPEPDMEIIVGGYNMLKWLDEHEGAFVRITMERTSRE